MKPIRLAWVATHPIQYQAPLLRRLAARPHLDVTALFFSDFSSRDFLDREMGRRVEWDVPLLEGYRHEFLQTRRDVADQITFWHPRIRRLSPILTKDRFDAVLVQGWNHHGQVEAIWAAKRNGLRTLLRCEATDHVSGSSGVKRQVRNGVVRFILAHADRCMAIGSHNRNFYLSRGVAKERIGSMPYCVDNDYFRARADEVDVSALRSTLGLGGARPVLLYASKLTARKHADLLLDAYLRLEPALRPYLLFVGDGELRPELERRVAAHGLSQDVRFLGFLNQGELPAFYALADVFCLPSVNETWGLVVNEAMNAGCAILATDQVGSAADLVRNGENGFAVRPYNVDALAAGLADMLADGRYLDMGQMSRRMIAGWGLNECVAGLEAALDDLIPQAKSPSA